MKKLLILCLLIVTVVMVVSCAPPLSEEGSEEKSSGALAGQAIRSKSSIVNTSTDDKVALPSSTSRVALPNLPTSFCNVEEFNGVIVGNTKESSVCTKAVAGKFDLVDVGSSGIWCVGVYKGIPLVLWGSGADMGYGFMYTSNGIGLYPNATTLLANKGWNDVCNEYYSQNKENGNWFTGGSVGVPATVTEAKRCLDHISGSATPESINLLDSQCQ